MNDRFIELEANRAEPDYPVMSLRGVWIGLSLVGVLVSLGMVVMGVTGQ